MKKWYEVTLVLVLLSFQCTAKSKSDKFSLLTLPIDQFIQESIPVEERASFKEFYQQELIHQQALKKQSKKRVNAQQAYQRLCTAGKSALAVKDPQAARQLMAYAAENKSDMHIQKQLLTLYYRFGVYEEFKKQHVQKGTRIVAKAQDYLKNMSHKITAWFGGWRQSKAA